MGHQTDIAGWQLDEEGAANYERTLVPAFMDPWAADLIDAVELKPGERVLDVGCGTGIVARHAARRVGTGGSVAGVDVNPAMLAVAREVSADLDPPVAWRQAPADALPFADATFDAVLCQQAFQFFPDPTAALTEMHRALVPGGRVGLGTCQPVEYQPGYAVLTEVVTRHVGVAAGEVIRSPYALGDPDRLRALLTGAGFADVHVRLLFTTFRVPSAEAFLQAETSSSPLGDLVVRLDRDVLAALVEDLAGALDAYTDDDGVTFPFGTIVATAAR